MGDMATKNDNRCRAILLYSRYEKRIISWEAVVIHPATADVRHPYTYRGDCRTGDPPRSAGSKPWSMIQEVLYE